MEKKEYIVTALEETLLSPEDLLSGSWNEEMKKRMGLVIETEGPVRRSILYKRVILSFGMQKIGSRLIDLFDSVASSLDYPMTEDSNGESVFHSGRTEDYFRPTPESDVRYSYQIPYAEAANCLLYVLSLSEKPSLTKSELKEAFMLQMGWQRFGDKVEELFEAAAKDERIKRSGNGRFLKP